MELKLNPDGSLASASPDRPDRDAALPADGPPSGASGGVYLDSDPNATPAPATATATGSAPDGELVKDGDTASFMRDVIEESSNVPVIVDFWAPWCGPCKQLGPALEKMVRQAGGLVRLVKINVDENQELAAQMRVQSIPAVYGFKNGQPVDGFMGAVAESQLKTFFDKLLDGAKAPTDVALDQAQAALDAGDGQTADALFRDIQTQQPDNPKAIAGIIRAAMTRGDLALAREMVNGLPDDLSAQQEIAAAASALELAELGDGTSGEDLASLKASAEARPTDCQARFDYANALIGAGRNEEGLEQLFEIIRHNRSWQDEAARQQVLKVFEALGPTDPVTLDGRRKLSAILFS